VSQGFGFVAMTDELRGVPLGVAIAKLTGAGFEEDLESHGQLVAFAPIFPPLGGVRWLFRCPGLGKSPCPHRARILYRPLAVQIFACRHCFDLSYASRQRHRERFFEGFAKPWDRLERLSADLRSRSPYRRMRALSASASAVWRPMEVFTQGGSTKTILAATPRPVSRAELRRDPFTLERVLDRAFASTESISDVRG
jgi:hypothetical protein